MHAQQEPAQAESSAALATKKNRVAPTSSTRRAADASEELIEQEGEEDVDADGAADTAEENVGEVRKRVEKMSYEEAQSKTNDNNNDDDNAADESWEKIEKEEMENTKGDGLKRKALDRNDTSFTTVEEDVAAAKRQKDTTLPQRDPPRRAQTLSLVSPVAVLKRKARRTGVIVVRCIRILDVSSDLGREYNGHDNTYHPASALHATFRTLSR